MNEYSRYYEARNISGQYYTGYKLPGYILDNLPGEKDLKILDIGCGYGMALSALKEKGYENVNGIDLSVDAVKFCRDKGLHVIKADIFDFCKTSIEKFDLILMSHVLEHIEKSRIINLLSLVRSNLLNPGGSFYVMVPNAQSNTGAYWAYEDFTHHTLFTSGSIYYVLKSAGFNSVEFLDPDGISDSGFAVKIIKLLFLKIYKLKKYFWNKVTSSSYHEPSPKIFTYELKVLAK